MRNLNNTSKNDFNVWPVLIDMITSVLIIFILYSFLDQILNHRNLDLLLIDKKRQKFTEEFSKQFSNEMKDSTILLSPDFNYLGVTYSDKLLFPAGKYEEAFINTAGRRVLDNTITLLEENYDALDIVEIQVEGHTDNDVIKKQYKKINDNWDLSTQRAATITKYLIKNKLNTDSILFSANGFSKFDPIVSNSSPKNKSKNRRIELKIYFKGLDK